MLIDGKACAERLNELTHRTAERLRAAHGIEPALAVVLVGDDPASEVYVRNKIRTAQRVGIRSVERRLPSDTTTDALLREVRQLNADPSVHGILVQLPLPAQVDEARIVDAIAPEKDVDGFHVINSGRLATGVGPALVPCTPQGCVLLAKQQVGDLSGLHAVVVGRSNIVGKPLAALLLRENCSVTVVHSKSRGIEALCRQADLLFVAIGRAETVRADWVKEGAVVIDVGINRVDRADGGSRLVGDVDLASVSARAAAITPVPGGVGPMTIACLMRNTLTAACRQRGLDPRGVEQGE